LHRARVLSVSKLLLILIVFLTTSAMAAEVGQLDSLLAQPTTGELSISTEEARQKISQIEALAATAPHRKLEIEAYLIPYRKIAGMSAPDATRQNPVTPPKPKPLLLVRSVEGSLHVIRANAVSAQGRVLMVEGADGTRSAWQKEFLVGQLEWFNDTEIESGAVDLIALAARYEYFASIYPAAKAELIAEAKKLREIHEKKRAEERDQAEAKRRELAMALGEEFDPAKLYTRETLARILLAAEKAAQDFPAHAAELAERMKPFRQRFEALLAGKVLIDGIWRTAEEAQELEKSREFDQKRRAFADGFTATIDPVALSNAAIARHLGVPAALVLALFLIGLMRAFSRRPGMIRRLSGVVLTAASAGGAIYYGILLMSGSWKLPTRAGAGESDTAGKIASVIFYASLEDPAQIPPAERDVTVIEREVNDFLRNRIAIGEAPAESGALRLGIDARLISGGVIITETVRYRGRVYPIRYEVIFGKLAAQPEITSLRVMVGRAPVTGPLKRALWDSLSAQLEKACALRQVLTRYRPAEFSAAELSLTLNPTESAPTNAPLPESAPVGAPLPDSPRTEPAAPVPRKSPTPLDGEPGIRAPGEPESASPNGDG
jgi:hypothetical protein